MKWLYEKLLLTFDAQHLVYSETDYEPIIEKIRAEASENSLVLLKGSRGMKLELILKNFK